MRLKRNLFLWLLGTAMGGSALIGCTGIDCPFDKKVDMGCTIYATETQSLLTLTDTLTVTAVGTDSVLLNKGISLNEFQLPLRYQSGTDTLVFRFSNNLGQWARDTIFVDQTARPHFESNDCPMAIYHQIDAVRWTSHALADMPLTIDNVTIQRTTVGYDNEEHLRIYLRATAGQ